MSSITSTTPPSTPATPHNTPIPSSELLNALNTNMNLDEAMQNASPISLTHIFEILDNITNSLDTLDDGVGVYEN